jgi:hypothetical protein
MVAAREACCALFEGQTDVVLTGAEALALALAHGIERSECCAVAQ